MKRLLAILGFCALGLLLLGAPAARAAGNTTVTLGDSLTAEYDAVQFQPPWDSVFGTLPTEYADVTVPGWVSRSWVEVLGILRPGWFDFGGFDGDAPGHGFPRATGYEHNWAVPGADAGQIEEFLSNPVYGFPFGGPRYPLDETLETEADRVVVWVGANDFRANFGFLYDGGSPGALINGLVSDLTEILDYVDGRNNGLKIVVVNVPDLGATPSKQEDHPDPVKRARVTAATAQANAAIAALCAGRGIPVADVFSLTADFIAGTPFWFGAIALFPGSDPDNEPRHLFTRDGFHPNTCAQIEIARRIVEAFRTGHGLAIPQITDAEALGLLGLDNDLPYREWIAGFAVGTRTGFRGDPDRDGMTNLEEYTFGLEPDRPDPDSRPVWLEPSAGPSAPIRMRYRPDPARVRHIATSAWFSDNLVGWSPTPAAWSTAQPDGSVLVEAPPGPAGRRFLRLRFDVLDP